MAVVLGGLGQPEESPLVTGGLGLAGTAPPGAMRATLAGAGALSGTLTGGDVPTTPGAPWGASQWAIPVPWQQPRPSRPGWITANLAGASALTADPTFALDPDALVAELAAALLLDLV